MTHDHDEGRLAPECAYKDGYIRGRHEKEAMVTVASVLDAMEGRNGRGYGRARGGRDSCFGRKVRRGLGRA